MLAGHRDPDCSGLGAGRISSSPGKCSAMPGLSALVPQGKPAAWAASEGRNDRILSAMCPHNRDTSLGLDPQFLLAEFHSCCF